MMTTLLLAVHLAGTEPAANYPAPNLLVEVDDPKLKEFHLLDVRPKAKYGAGHVPGAVHADAAPWSKAILANNADAAFWKLELAKLGVTPKQPTVVYADDARDAARAWWMLKYAGVPDVRILNGGWKAWTAAKLEETKLVSAGVAPGHDWKPGTARLADKKHVLEQLKGGSVCIDARTPEEFSGEKALAKKGGHIPGATHLEWVELLDPKTDKFLPPARQAGEGPQDRPGQAGGDVLPGRWARRGGRVRAGTGRREERAQLLPQLGRVGQRDRHPGRGQEEVTARVTRTAPLPPPVRGRSRARRTAAGRSPRATGAR